MKSLPVALVTGATSGFGWETAKLLAENGYQVYASYRSAQKLKDLKGLEKKLALKSIYIDVTKPATITKAVASILKKENRVDLLVNNAGFVVAGFLEDLSDQDLKEQFDTNVVGVLRMIRAVAPSMRGRMSGKIINIGSISGRVVFPGIGAYAASKFALRSLTEGLRQELGPSGIQVCEIAPGTFATRVVSSTRFGKNVLAPHSAYKNFRELVEKKVEASFKNAAPAVKVAELILRISGQARLSPVYMAGTDAKVMNFLKRRLPDSWFEGLFMKIFPWSRFPEAVEDLK